MRKITFLSLNGISQKLRNFRPGVMKTPYYSSFGLYSFLPLASNFFKLHIKRVPSSTTTKEREKAI